MEVPKYQLKGLTPGGFALDRIDKSFKRQEYLSKEDLIANDTHAVTYTFEKILKEVGTIS